MRHLELFNQNIVGSNERDFDYNCVIAPYGDFERVEDINAIILSIRNIILTPLGSYIFDPEYGTDLYKKVFEPQDEITKNAIEDEILYRISTIETRAEIEDIKIKYLNNNKGFSVEVLINYNEEKGVVKAIIDENLINNI